MSSVGTLGKDPEEFQVSPSAFLHIIILTGPQKVTVFSPDGAHLAVAGGKEVRFSDNSSLTFLNKHALAVPLDDPRSCIREDTGQ